MYSKSDLTAKAQIELIEIAKGMGIAKATRLDAQELIYKILDYQASNPVPQAAQQHVSEDQPRKRQHMKPKLLAESAMKTPELHKHVKKPEQKGEERKADNTTTISKLIEGAKKAAQHTYSNGYHYGDAHSWDGTNMKDDNGKNTVSCDRGVGLSLYYAGLTNTDPYKLTLTVLDKELSSKGWKKITNYNELQPGDIVYYKNSDGSLKHVFLIG